MAINGEPVPDDAINGKFVVNYMFISILMVL